MYKKICLKTTFTSGYYITSLYLSIVSILSKKYMKDENMKRILIIIFLLFITSVELLASSKLDPTPIWLKPGKAFSQLERDEQFYFIKFKEKIYDTNQYLIAFIVYSFSPSQKKWTVWDYNPNNKDFQKIKRNQVFKHSTIINLNYTNGSRRYDHYDINKMYHVFIQSNTAVHSSDFQGETKNILISPPNAPDKRYFKREELNSLRLINYNQKTGRHSLKEGAETSVYFDSSGYGVFGFNKTQPKKIETALEPPEIPKLKPDINEKKIEVLPDKQITRYGNAYLYFKNFGYVHLNAICFHSKSITPLQKYIVTTITPNNIIYSPVKAAQEVFYFYTPSKDNVIHYLWCQSENSLQPIGTIYYNSESLSFKFEQNRRLLQKNLSLNARSTLLKWDEAINAYNQSTFQEKEMIKAYLCKTDSSINSVFNQFILFQQNNNQHLLTDISTYVNSSQIKVNSQFTLHKNQENWFLNNNFYSEQRLIPIKISTNLDNTMQLFELVINDDGDKALYCRTLLYNTKFHFKNPEWHYQKMRQKTVSTNKLWVIMDDYVDPDHFMAKRLFEFKKSYRIKQILFKNSNILRFDLIKGSTIFRKELTHPSILDSTDTRFSEIMALSNLEEHTALHMNNSWELHLFLARKTNALHPDTVTNISHKLKEMNVKKIVLWEFFDFKPNEKTVYNQLFEQVSNKMKIDFIYKKICSINDFYTIKMKGYDHEI